MLVFLTIFLPPDIAERIDKERAKYDPKYKRLAPHITLIPPFEPNMDIEPALREIRKSLGFIPPIEISLNGLGHFKRLTNSAVFVDVTDGNELKEVQKTIYYILEKCGAKLGKYKHSPNFHVTIAKRLSLPALINTYRKLKGFEVNQSFRAEKIAVCTINGNETWQIKEEIYFKNEEASSK